MRRTREVRFRISGVERKADRWTSFYRVRAESAVRLPLVAAPDFVECLFQLVISVVGIIDVGAVALDLTIAKALRPVVTDATRQCFECHQPQKAQDYVFSTYIP